LYVQVREGLERDPSIREFMIEERASMEEDFKRGEREMRASETGDGENFAKRATRGVVRSRHILMFGGHSIWWVLPHRKVRLCTYIQGVII
jgi:hypothetical protein